MRLGVLTCAYNTPGEWLLEAGESVHIHDFPAWAAVEYLVVDDGSDRSDTGAALGALERRGVRVLRLPHGGVGRASNAGIEALDVDVILRLDADDRLVRGWARAALEHIRAHHVDAVSGSMVYISPDGEEFMRVRRAAEVADTQHRDSMTHGGSLLLRSAWQRAGGYPEGLRRATDWHFWERLERAGARFSRLADFSIERRIHPGSVSFDKSKHLQRAWARYLARKGAAS